MPTLEQIRAKMHKLQKQADALIARQAQKVVDQIRSLMIEHGLTTADIEAAAKKRRQGAGRASVKASAKGPMPARYRNPKTGETWSGFGRPPAWIATARDRSRFLIAKGAEVATKKAVSQGRAGNALYRDPATGKTWTGHGRAPGWIAQAKDRAVFLIGNDKAKPAAAGKVAKKTAAKSASANLQQKRPWRQSLSSSAPGKRLPPRRPRLHRQRRRSLSMPLHRQPKAGNSLRLDTTRCKHRFEATTGTAPTAALFDGVQLSLARSHPNANAPAKKRACLHRREEKTSSLQLLQQQHYRERIERQIHMPAKQRLPDQRGRKNRGDLEPCAAQSANECADARRI